jgi:hypothetical protein
MTRQISRALHVLLLHEAGRRASVNSDAELGVNECLDHATAALKGELCAELSAEAQQWFLAALACDPRNVEALVGLALTCRTSSAILGGPAICVPLQRYPTLAAKRSRSPSKSNRGMLTRVVFKGCCIRRLES